MCTGPTQGPAARNATPPGWATEWPAYRDAILEMQREFDEVVAARLPQTYATNTTSTIPVTPGVNWWA